MPLVVELSGFQNNSRTTARHIFAAIVHTTRNN